jgi:phosphatidylglycerophosphate synthase
VPPGRRWLTWANALTFLRLLAAPLLATAVLSEHPVVASLLFFGAVASDFADGWVARRFDEVSPFGGLVDHAVDAAFVTVGTAALAGAGVLPAVLPLLIGVAFLQYAFDSRHLSERGLHPNPIGRVNGIAYYVIVAVPIVRDALGLGWPGPGFVRALGWALVATTLVSMLDRLRLLLRRRPDAGLSRSE